MKKSHGNDCKSFLCLLQMNSDSHVRKLEDNLAEANAKLANLEKNQAELNAFKIRLSGKQDILVAFFTNFSNFLIKHSLIHISLRINGLYPNHLPHVMCFSFSSGEW